MKPYALIAVAIAGLSACSPAPKLGPTTPGLAELEFVESCAQVYDYDNTLTYIKSAGWEPVRTDSHPVLKAVVMQGVQQDMDVVGGFKSMQGNWGKETYLYKTTNTDRRAYRKMLDGRDFYLILMTHRMRGGHVQYGCFLYDFQEGYKLGVADQSGMIQEWLQHPPTGYNDIDDVTSIRVWGPDVLPEGLYLLNVGVSNINDTRKVRKNIGFYGRSWFALTTTLRVIKPEGSDDEE